jgi:hypothetical protein
MTTRLNNSDLSRAPKRIKVSGPVAISGETKPDDDLWCFEVSAEEGLPAWATIQSLRIFDVEFGKRLNTALSEESLEKVEQPARLFGPVCIKPDGCRVFSLQVWFVSPDGTVQEQTTECDDYPVQEKIRNRAADARAEKKRNEGLTP